MFELFAFNMPDIIDIIIDRLSLSSLDLLDKVDLNSDRSSRYYSEELQKSLGTIEDVYLNRCSLEVKNKTELLVSKTRKHKYLLDKYTNQFKKLQIVEVKNANQKKIKAYNQQLKGLESRLNELTNIFGGTQPEEMFIKVHDMQKKIEELEMKSNEINERLQYYEKFPASITEAQYCIADLKQRIKDKESILDSNLYGKNCD